MSVRWLCLVLNSWTPHSPAEHVADHRRLCTSWPAAPGFPGLAALLRGLLESSTGFGQAHRDKTSQNAANQHCRFCVDVVTTVPL